MTRPDLLIYTTALSPRLAYISQYIFETLLGQACQLTADVTTFNDFKGLRLNYSTRHFTGTSVQLRPSPLLFQQGVQEQLLSTQLTEGVPIIFGSLPGGDLPFDPLAASFFILSRYEEYLAYVPDTHGRYAATLSWAHRSQCLQQPIIWEWTKLLQQAIQRYYPNWQPRPPAYRFLPTYDVDIPWAYRHRGLRGVARMMLDLFQGKWESLRARWRVGRGQSDPYDTFAYLHDLHQKHNTPARFFWLLGDPGRYDINPSHRLTDYQNLIKHTAQWAEVGIHPSYRAFDDSRQLTKELDRLASIIQGPVQHSRQHYLRLCMPTTYQQLLAAGIEHDYTMGFADTIGYRAGTTEAFWWFDLSKNEVTTLRIHPFVAMEVSLRMYQHLSPSEAQAQLLQLQQYCIDNQLTFSTLWHNSSFSDLHGWSGWRTVYQHLFQQN